MEALEKIKRKIDEDVNEKIKEIEDNAEREIAEVRRKAEEAWNAKKKHLLLTAQKEKEVVYSRIVSNAKLETKRAILEAREEVLSRAKEMMAKRIANLPPQEYERFIIRAVSKAVKEIGPNLVVRTRPQDIATVRSAVGKVLPSATVVEDTGIKLGGVIFTDPTGNVILRYTFEDVMDRSWSRVRAELARKLFEVE